MSCYVTYEVEAVPLNNPRQLSNEQDTSIQVKRYTVEIKEQSGEEEKLMCTANISMCREDMKNYCIKTRQKYTF
jgi:hypothetical protein